MRRSNNTPLDSLLGLYQDNMSGPINMHTLGQNVGYTPPWNPQQTNMMPQVQVPNDIIGTAVMNHSQWGPWFDAMGASQPGGVRVRGAVGMPDSLNGLQAAGPSPHERLMRQAQMQNQAQPAANFYPNAKNFPYTPYPQA